MAINDKMIVSLEDTVQKRTNLISYNTNKGGTYFVFYLFESAGSKIHLTAFNKCAETLFPLIYNNEYI